MSAMEAAMDNLSGIAVFVQAAENRSFTEAGRMLGISSSAVGKTIARLEERMAVRLFHRSTRSITLTAEGTCFLERCRRILCEVEAAQAELSQASGEPRGVLRVSLPHAGDRMMPIMTDFMRKYPEIELHLDLSDRMVDVIEEGFDAVLRTGEPQDSRLMSRRVGTFSLVIVASPAYLKRHGTPGHPRDLEAHACLLHRFPASGKIERWPLRGKTQPTLSAALVCNAVDGQIYAATQGLGLACVPDFIVSDAIAAGKLKRVLDDHVSHTGKFWLLWPSSRHASPKLRAFIEHMSAHIAQK